MVLRRNRSSGLIDEPNSLPARLRMLLATLATAARMTSPNPGRPARWLPRPALCRARGPGPPAGYNNRAGRFEASRRHTGVRRHVTPVRGRTPARPGRGAPRRRSVRRGAWIVLGAAGLRAICASGVASIVSGTAFAFLLPHLRDLYASERTGTMGELERCVIWGEDPLPRRRLGAGAPRTADPSPQGTAASAAVPMS